MRLAPFLLDQWLEERRPDVAFDLASSTGPSWTLDEVLGLATNAQRRELSALPVLYSPSQGTDALRTAVARLHGCSVEDVQIVTGAAEALLVLFSAVSDRDANVVVPFPGFPPFEALPHALGLEVRRYLLDPAGGFRFDVEAITGLIDRATRLVLVNTPHNPTGAVADRADVERLHTICVERGVQFVVDEVYHPVYFVGSGRSAADLEGATVIGDLSKAYCLSGLRVGWIIDRNARRREHYLNARSYFTIANSSVCEALGAIALSKRESILARVQSVAGRNRASLDNFMSRHANAFSYTPPAGGLTSFPALNGAESSRPFCERAAEAGVLLAPGDCFGMPNHFRLGFGASGDRFEEALARLERVLDEYAR